MVGPPQVDDTVKTPAELVGMVGDIRCKISGHAVVPDHYPVLVVAECGGLQPQGAVLFIHVSLFQQPVAGFFDLAAFVQRLLAEPHIKTHIETFQVFL